MYLVVVLVVLIVVKVLTGLRKNSKWDHFPGLNSYSSLPLIGHAYKLKRKPVETIDAMRKKFGDIFRLDIGNYPTIFVCNYEDMIALFRQDVFCGRANKTVMLDVKGVDAKGQVGGILASWGNTCKEHKKFINKQLVDMITGDKDKMSTLIESFAAQHCATLSRKAALNQGVVTFRHFFTSLPGRVVWKLMTGKDDISDQRLEKITKDTDTLFTRLSAQSLLSVMELNSPAFYRIFRFLRLDKMGQLCAGMIQLLKSEVKEACPDEGGTFIERMLAESRKKHQDSESVFSKDRAQMHINATLFDLFTGGTDTSGTILEWCLLYLAAHPDIQEKTFEQIRDNLGNRPVSMRDIDEASLTMAFLHEVLRHSPMTSVDMPHMTTDDAEYNGIHFPKGTQVLASLRHVHMDGKLFPSPNTFDLSRWLTLDGRFKSNPHFVPFSMGRRKCPGETLAIGMAFINLATFIKHFRFSALESDPLSFDYHFSIVVAPKKCRLRVTHRHNVQA